MKSKSLILLCLSGLLVNGCSVLPLQTKIKENHFRFENFKRDIENDKEYVHLLCANHKPVGWTQPKQYPSGEHDLWVRAVTYRSHIPHSRKEAFTHIKVTLAPEKSYMLNREIRGDKIAMWIQEVDTGTCVSEVVTAQLERPLGWDYHQRVQQCRQGSI